MDPKKLNTINKLKRLKFVGVDVSLDIALFEYGFIWKETKDKYIFIYGVKNFGDGFIEFEYVEYNKPIDPKEEWDWVDWDDVCEFCGVKQEEFFKNDFPMIVNDLNHYYGSDNIFGGNCDIEIRKNPFSRKTKDNSEDC
jgi:hypothetical protein